MVFDINKQEGPVIILLIVNRNGRIESVINVSLINDYCTIRTLVMTVTTVSLSFSDRDGVQALSLIESGCDPHCDCPRPPSGLALSDAAHKCGHNEPSTER